MPMSSAQSVGRTSLKGKPSSIHNPERALTDCNVGKREHSFHSRTAQDLASAATLPRYVTLLFRNPAKLTMSHMELALIVSTVFRRYEFELYQDTLETREGFLRKPLALMVGMKQRK
jgi:hypothetical protein